MRSACSTLAQSRPTRPDHLVGAGRACGGAENALPDRTLRPVAAATSVFCHTHHNTWRVHGNRPVAEFAAAFATATEPAGGTSMLEQLPPGLRLEIAYGLQCRRDERATVTRPTKAAQNRGLYRTALQLYLTAFSPEASRAAAGMLHNAGRVDEALAFYQHATASGDSTAPRAAAWMLREAGDTDKALAVLRNSVEAGDRLGLWDAAQTLDAAGRTDEALLFYQRTAALDANPALRQAAGMLERAGRSEEAFTYYRRAADAGDSHALEAAAAMLGRAGHIDEAVAWLTTRIKTDSSRLMRAMAVTFADAGRIDDALIYCRRAGEVGDNAVVWIASALLEQAGRKHEAAELYRQGFESDGSIAAPWTVSELSSALLGVDFLP